MRSCWAVLLAALAGLPAMADIAPQHFTAQGVAIDLAVAAPDGLAVAGGDVSLALHFADSATGTPLSAASPAAWLSQRRAGEAPDDARCARKVGAFVGGSPIERPDADMTGFAVLALNRDPSVTVIDPEGGYGGSRVLALMALDSPGVDWALDRDAGRLYVAEPAAGKVAALDLETWQRHATVELPEPGNLALVPGQGLWVVETKGVVLLDADTLKPLAHVATGAGPHHLAADGNMLFVTNADGTASVIDTAQRAKRRDLPVGAAPVAIAASSLSGFAYVASDTGITVLDPARAEPVDRIEHGVGLAALAIAPGGRWGFAADPAHDQVVIFDTVTGRALQDLPVADGPAEFAFTQTEAYIRRRGSEVVTLVPLATLSDDGKPAGLAEFPSGEQGFPAAAAVLAGSMIAAPGEASMLLASPNERAVQFYHEGMAAPAGSFENAGRQPVAVAVIDRSLRQVSPGTYRAAVRLPPPGQYDVAVLLDAPKLVHCFTLDVAPRNSAAAAKLAIEPIALPPKVTVGETLALRFRALDPATQQQRTDLAALTAQAVLAPGTWHRRFPLVRGKGGNWELEFTPPEPGIYLLSFEADGMPLGSGGNYTFEAVGPHG